MMLGWLRGGVPRRGVSGAGCGRRGIDEGGLPGLARGAWRGGSGALLRPLAAALEAGAHFAESVRSAVSGGGGTLLPTRPPR